MKRLLLILLSAITLFSCIACKPGGGQNGGNVNLNDEPIHPENQPAYTEAIEVSSLKRTESGKKYLEVNGRPFLMLGVQLRTDLFMQLDGLTLDDLDYLFKLVDSVNVTCVQIPICWRDIEPRKNQYTNHYVEKYIEYCNKYNIKLELLWFGSYMCGYSVEGYVPSYVVEDLETYPAYSNNSFNGWLGKHYFLRPSTKALIEREKKAIEFMMEGIWEYDRMHGGRRTVIGIQIENEPDMLATRHNNDHGYSNEQIWPDLAVMLDELGQSVKNSKYKCYTRVNLVTDGNYESRAEDLVNSEGIDFAGIDPYDGTVNGIKQYVNSLDFGENFSHIAENGGEFENTNQLELQAFKQGAGYEVFEIITTDNPQLVDWTLRGLYNPDKTKKAHTDSVIIANQMYKRAYVDIVLADSVNFLAFNLISNGAMKELVQTNDTDSVTVKFKTTTGGVAFAIERDGYLTVASSSNDTMEFSGANLGEVEEGAYSLMGEWKKMSSESLKNGVLTMKAGCVYRIKIN